MEQSKALLSKTPQIWWRAVKNSIKAALRLVSIRKRKTPIQCVPLLTKTHESAIPAISTGLLTEMRTSAFISYCGITEDHSHGSLAHTFITWPIPWFRSAAQVSRDFCSGSLWWNSKLAGTTISSEVQSPLFKLACLLIEFNFFCL